MAEIRALIFDLGNVLHRYDGVRLRHNLAALTNGRATFADLDRFIAETGINHQVDAGAQDAATLHAAYVAGVGLVDDHAAFVAAWNDVFTPQDDIERLLDRLQGRYRLVVLSNINPLHVEYLTENLALLERFDARIYSCEIRAMKPDPAAFAAAVAAAGVPAQQCLFMDDLEANVAGARACGLQAFRFTTVAGAETRLAALGVL